jgi:hypothetical protein
LGAQECAGKVDRDDVHPLFIRAHREMCRDD